MQNDSDVMRADDLLLQVEKLLSRGRLRNFYLWRNRKLLRRGIELHETQYERISLFKSRRVLDRDLDRILLFWLPIIPVWRKLECYLFVHVYSNGAVEWFREVWNEHWSW